VARVIMVLTRLFLRHGCFLSCLFSTWATTHLWHVLVHPLQRAA